MLTTFYIYANEWFFWKMPCLRRSTRTKDNTEATAKPKVKASQNPSSTMEGSRQTGAEKTALIKGNITGVQQEQQKNIARQVAAVTKAATEAQQPSTDGPGREDARAISGSK
jgi:hypothetical protein